MAAKQHEESVRAEAMADRALTEWCGDGQFDDIVAFLRRLFDAPVALVSLVEVERQRFLGKSGLSICETPRSVSFCAHAMLRDELMVVPDATDDPRFADNALVTGEMNLRFYAGAPLITPDGIPLGALCVIDTRPRDGITELQRDGLLTLARQVMAAIEARRLVEERSLLAREMNHRVKNLFALFGSVIHFSDDLLDADARVRLIERIGALDRAHGLILPDADGAEPADTMLRTVLDTVLEPYGGRNADRVVIDGDDMPLAANRAAPVALIFHELATNAAKYGALSLPGGRVTVTIRGVDGMLRIGWRETGGPTVDVALHGRGFGSRLIEAASRRQLGGELRRDWQVDGLSAELSFADGMSSAARLVSHA